MQTHESKPSIAQGDRRLTRLESMKLRLLKEKAPGITQSHEALELALHAEQLAKDCGVHDPAYLRMKEEQKLMEDLALLLEIEAGCASDPVGQ